MTSSTVSGPCGGQFSKSATLLCAASDRGCKTRPRSPVPGPCGEQVSKSGRARSATVCTHKHRHPPAPCEQGFSPENVACLSVLGQKKLKRGWRCLCVPTVHWCVMLRTWDPQQHAGQSRAHHLHLLIGRHPGPGFYSISAKDISAKHITQEGLRKRYRRHA
jgi:hypothetical protein